jgi:hypothetical protein
LSTGGGGAPRGAQLGAEAGPPYQQFEAGSDRQAHDHQEQPVDPDVQTWQVDLSLQEARQRQRLLLIAEEEMSRTDRHQHQANREQHLVQMGGPVQAPIQHPLENHSHQAYRDHHHRQRRQEGHAGMVQQRHAQIPPEHRKGAVREVHESHQPQCHRQSDADQEQQHPRRNAIEEHGHGCQPLLLTPLSRVRQRGWGEVKVVITVCPDP